MKTDLIFHPFDEAIHLLHPPSISLVIKCNAMKASELKKELESYGISTKSLFEKSEFVRAVAEARVDGVTTKSGGRNSAGQQQKDEPIDPSFRDVAVSKFSGESKMAMGGAVIDVKAR